MKTTLRPALATISGRDHQFIVKLYNFKLTKTNYACSSLGTDAPNIMCIHKSVHACKYTDNAYHADKPV